MSYSLQELSVKVGWEILPGEKQFPFLRYGIWGNLMFKYYSSIFPFTLLVILVVAHKCVIMIISLWHFSKSIRRFLTNIDDTGSRLALIYIIWSPAWIPVKKILLVFIWIFVVSTVNINPYVLLNSIENIPNYVSTVQHRL